MVKHPIPASHGNRIVQRPSVDPLVVELGPADPVSREELVGAAAEDVGVTERALGADGTDSGGSWVGPVVGDGPPAAPLVAPGRWLCWPGSTHSTSSGRAFAAAWVSSAMLTHREHCTEPPLGPPLAVAEGVALDG